MDTRAQNIINQVASLTGDFGTSVQVSRTTNATKFDIYGNPLDGTTAPSTVNLIIESVQPMLIETLAGGKSKVQMKAISQSGLILEGDEITYNGRKFKVTGVEPVNFVGSDVVNFVTAEGEVNA